MTVKPDSGDKDGYYVPIIGNFIDNRYEILSLMGQGVYGNVVKVYDHKNDQNYAMKISRKQTCSEGLQELKILRILMKEDKDDVKGIVRLVDRFEMNGHIVIVMELMDYTLHDMMFNPYLDQRHLARTFTKDVCLTLELLKKNHIIHGDLKPDNVMRKESGDEDQKGVFKLIDYGMSQFDDVGFEYYGHEYQCLTYRAPEVLLGMEYGTEVDMWSLGCILAQLFYGEPWFSGLDEEDQMARMMEVLGLPPPKMASKSTRWNKFFSKTTGSPLYCESPIEQAMKTERPIRGAPGTCLVQVDFNDEEAKVALDFIFKCLKWDPEERMTPSQALNHPYLTNMAL